VLAPLQPFHQQAPNGFRYGSIHQRLERRLPVAFSPGVSLSEEIAGGQHDRLQGGRATSLVAQVTRLQEFVEAAGNHGFEQGKFIVVVVVERGTIDRGCFGNILN